MFNPYPNLPHQIKNYVLNSIIGQGSFGIVYKAVNLFYNREFAIKVLCHSKNVEQNFITYESEINSLKKLNHPNIVQLYDYFQADDNLFIVLEYCNGGTLEEKIKNNEEISESDKIKICSQLISALNYCYEKYVTHQDIKTANILFDNGRIKIADFGLSTIVDHDENINVHRGTLSYSAPEVCQNYSFNPFKSDIWSLGVLFYRLFTYSYPFEGCNKDELKKTIINGYYTEKETGVIRKVVEKMLVVNPDDRISIEKLSKMKLFESQVGLNVKKQKMFSLIIPKNNNNNNLFNTKTTRKSCLHFQNVNTQRIVYRHLSVTHFKKNNHNFFEHK